MPARGDYFDGCPSAHALDLIGDRWALLVVRELLLGPKRFTDLRRGLPKISRNVLSQRLDDLEAAEVLRRRMLAPPSAAAVYELTERGLELETVLQAIGRWGAASPLLPKSDSVGVDTFVLGLRSLYDSVAGDGLDARYELQIEQEAFDFRIVDGRLEVQRGASDPPSTRLTVDVGAMAAVARGDQPLTTALLTTDAAGDGEPGRFARLFRRPVGAAGPLAGDGPGE
jgi:DNA-binding HxlR family transcriptional regulator